MIEYDPKPNFVNRKFAGVDIRCIKNSRLGVVPAPKNIPELLYVITEWAQQATMRTVWRGMADLKNWNVDSGIIRDMKYIVHYRSKGGMKERVSAYYDYLSDIEQKTVEDERHKLNKMRGQGWDMRNGIPLSEAQMFAVLQHHGGATRFIDFTANVFIALWFAACLHPQLYGTCGYLVGLNPQHDTVKELEDSELLLGTNRGEETRGTFQEVFEKYPRKEIFTWTPTFLYERMRIQQSVLVFSQSHIGFWSSLSSLEFKHESASNRFIAIAISPSFKLQLSNQLSNLLGYDAAMMFPDLDGFSRYYAAETTMRELQSLDVYDVSPDLKW